MMNIISVHFYIIILHLALISVPLLSKVPGNQYSKFHCDGLNHAKQEISWIKKISEDIALRKKSLNITLRKTQELLLTLPDAANKTDYLDSFPNRFALVHRLASVWPMLRTLPLVEKGYKIKRAYSPANVSLVYQSAVRGVARLQEKFNMTTETLAGGEMRGAYPYTAMTAAAVMDVAMFYHRHGHPWRAESWLLEALRRSETDNSVSRRTVLEYLHVVKCYTGDHKGSFEFFNRLIEEYPSFSIDKELQDDYNFMANTSCSDISKKMEAALFDNYHTPFYTTDPGNFCNPASYNPPLLLDRRLRCRLVHYNKPHLKLAPFKVEEMNLDPPILVFHDVIHDGQMETIRRLFYNRMKPSVLDYGSINPYFDMKYNNWLYDKDHPVTKMINRKAEATGNLEPWPSAPMVASYGTGAETNLHLDGMGDEEFVLFSESTRPDYVTTIFYLSEVSEGGFTVFPNLDLAVVPVKGSALMWHNRLPDLTLDFRLVHAGCPVIRGTKWIMTKWTHLKPQHYPACLPGKDKSRMYYYLPDCL